MRKTLWGVFVVGVSLAGVLGEEKKPALLLYDENFDHPAGTVVLETSKMKMKSEKLSITVGELKIPASMEMMGSEEISGHYLTRDKVRYLKVKSRTTNTMTIAGEAQPAEPEKDVLEGIPILADRVDKKWTLRFEKGEPNKEQREELEELVEEFNSDEDEQMYGKKPREIGESWVVDAALLPTFKDSEVTGKVKLTLVGERQYHGMRCAILEGSISATMKMEEDDGEMTIRIKGEVEVLRSLMHFSDVKYSLSGSMKMLGEYPTPNGLMKLEAAGPMEMSGGLEFNKGKPKAALE